MTRDHCSGFRTVCLTFATADDRFGAEPGLPTRSNYAELSILDYRKSRALGNGLGIASGSGQVRDLHIDQLKVKSRNFH